MGSDDTVDRRRLLFGACRQHEAAERHRFENREQCDIFVHTMVSLCRERKQFRNEPHAEGVTYITKKRKETFCLSVGTIGPY